MGSSFHFLTVASDQFPSKGALAPNGAQSQTSPCKCNVTCPQEDWAYYGQLSFNQGNCYALTWAVPTWKNGNLPLHIESPGLVEEMNLIIKLIVCVCV